MSGGTNHCMLELLYLCFEWDNNFLGGGKAQKKPLKCIQAKIRFGGVICLEVLCSQKANVNTKILSKYCICSYTVTRQKLRR